MADSKIADIRGVILPCEGPLRIVTVPGDIWEQPERAAEALGLVEGVAALPIDDAPYRTNHNVDVAHLYSVEFACSLYIAGKPAPTAKPNPRATSLCQRLHAVGKYKLHGDALLVGASIAEINRELTHESEVSDALVPAKAVENKARTSSALDLLEDQDNAPISRAPFAPEDQASLEQDKAISPSRTSRTGGANSANRSCAIS